MKLDTSHAYLASAIDYSLTHHNTGWHSAAMFPAPSDDIHMDTHFADMTTNRRQTSVQHMMATLNQHKYREPAPLPHIHTQGTLPHQGIHDQSIAAKYDLTLMHDAAFAWKGGQGKYWLGFAKKYLMAWIHTYHHSNNPIDETNFDHMISTYTVLKSQLSAKEKQQAHDFFSAWGWDYIHTAEYAQKKDKVNGISNWQSHRIKLATMLATATDDKKLFSRAKALFKYQIEKNITPDGTTYDFKQRDAIHYVVYDLQPLVQAALAAKTKGEDWFNWTSKTGSSLSKAVDWLTPYATGEKPHMEFVHSKEKFDHIRQEANVPGFSGLFQPKDAGDLYWYLTGVDHQFTDVAQKMQADPPAEIAFLHT